MPIKRGYIIASNKVAIDKEIVGWMYREEATDETDSGWRVFSGYEDEEYANNSDNFGIYDAETIINIDKTIEVLLDSPIGSEYERAEEGMLVEIKEDENSFDEECED